MDHYCQHQYKPPPPNTFTPNGFNPAIHAHSMHLTKSVEFSSFLKVEVIEGQVTYNSLVGTFLSRSLDQHGTAAPARDMSSNSQSPSLESRLENEESCTSSSDDKREQRLERMRDYSRTRIIDESPDARDRRLTRMRNSERMRRIFESEEKRAQRLQRLRDSERKRRMNESKEAREMRLQRLRNSERARRMRETAEAREKRLSRMRDYSRMRWMRRKSSEKDSTANFKV